MKFFFIKFLLHNRIFFINKKKSPALNLWVWNFCSRHFNLKKCWINRSAKHSFFTKLKLSRYNFKRLQSLGFLPLKKK